MSRSTPAGRSMAVLARLDRDRLRALSAIERDRQGGAQRRARRRRAAFRERSRFLRACAAGLAATHYGFPQGDALASFGVAVFIAVAGYRLGRRTIDTLLDAAPRDLTPRNRAAIRDVPGVIALDGLRLRSVGAEVIGEATIGVVAHACRVEQAARIKAAVAEAILAVAPLAARHRSPPIRARSTTKRSWSASCWSPRAVTSRASRHRPADRRAAGHRPRHRTRRRHAAWAAPTPSPTDFESAIRDEFGADVEIETHIEPLAPHVLIGRDATRGMRTNSRRRSSAARPGRLYREFHDVRVRETAGGLVVNYHCRVDAAVCRSRPCMPRSTRWSGACARNFRQISARSSATPSPTRQSADA